MAIIFNLEEKVTWDELSPSLQNRFLQAEAGNSVKLNGDVIGTCAKSIVKWIPYKDIGGNIWIEDDAGSKMHEFTGRFNVLQSLSMSADTNCVVMYQQYKEFNANFEVQTEVLVTKWFFSGDNWYIGNYSGVMPENCHVIEMKLKITKCIEGKLDLTCILIPRIRDDNTPLATVFDYHVVNSSNPNISDTKYAKVTPGKSYVFDFNPKYTPNNSSLTEQQRWTKYAWELTMKWSSEIETKTPTIDLTVADSYVPKNN